MLSELCPGWSTSHISAVITGACKRLTPPNSTSPPPLTSPRLISPRLTPQALNSSTLATHSPPRSSPTASAARVHASAGACGSSSSPSPSRPSSTCSVRQEAVGGLDLFSESDRGCSGSSAEAAPLRQPCGGRLSAAWLCYTTACHPSLPSPSPPLPSLDTHTLPSPDTGASSPPPEPRRPPLAGPRA